MICGVKKDCSEKICRSVYVSQLLQALCFERIMKGDYLLLLLATAITALKMTVRVVNSLLG